MDYSDLEYNFIDEEYVYSLKDDYGLFAIWKDANNHIDAIRDYLNSHFKIVLEANIKWSEKFFSENAARLYSVPLFKKNSGVDIRVDHSKKIGSLSFVVFVIKDKNPTYKYLQSVSGAVELSNTKIVKAKYLFRSWVSEKKNVKYAVHSTNNIKEFFSQAPMLFGKDIFHSLLNNETLPTIILQKDLEGAGGWNDYEHFLEITTLSSNYLILRNFKTLPLKNPGNDIDLLTDDYQLFASVAGAKQNPNKPYKATVMIDKTETFLDIRFFGDSYYYSKWELDMLRTKQKFKNFYVPATDHYFFSLLYHAIVQKPKLGIHYNVEMQKVARLLHLDWIPQKSFVDPKEMVKILNGFMKANGYYFIEPLDKKVYKNKDIILQLPNYKELVTKQSLKEKTKTALFRVIPKKWYGIYIKFRTGGTDRN